MRMTSICANKTQTLNRNWMLKCKLLIHSRHVLSVPFVDCVSMFDHICLHDVCRRMRFNVWSHRQTLCCFANAPKHSIRRLRVRMLDSNYIIQSLFTRWSKQKELYNMHLGFLLSDIGAYVYTITERYADLITSCVDFFCPLSVSRVMLIWHGRNMNKYESGAWNTDCFSKNEHLNSCQSCTERNACSLIRSKAWAAL